MTTAQRPTRVPSWPSLYNPGIEILHIEHHAPTHVDGAYLYHAKDIFRFTLYWTLIFYTPIFLLCGLYAFWNYAFPPSPLPPNSPKSRDSIYQLSTMAPNSAVPSIQSAKPPKPNERRSRVAFAVIIFMTFLILSVAGAVMGSAILGFAAAGLYKAGDFNMSTWIPFLLAVLQVVVGLLSVWPSIIEII
ncbi:hypothetical protein BYT27DRAFT_7121330 [Phlegmacium glaucopus]|nr:hypothetical protein BYT27DRAFT_7121330 [Phlegmacium glaucopus]